MTAEHEHDGQVFNCPSCKRIRSRRSVIMTRALHNPQGLTKYQYTLGLAKPDALQFWNDAKALGMKRVGTNLRGTPLYAMPSKLERA